MLIISLFFSIRNINKNIFDVTYLKEFLHRKYYIGDLKKLLFYNQHLGK